jgi:hypothetical protein
MRKRHTGRHLAAGRSGKPKKRIQGNGGCRNKLAAAHRGLTRRAGVDMVGKILHQEPRKDADFSVASGASGMRHRDNEPRPETAATPWKQVDI